jgi:hypothetical protein
MMRTDVVVGAHAAADGRTVAAGHGGRLSLALLAGVAYPLAPPFLYSAAAAPVVPAAHVAAVAAGILLVLAVPLAGAALLWSSAGQNDPGALRTRGIGMLLVLAPVLRALGIGVSGVTGLRGWGAAAAWVTFWAIASIGIAARCASRRPLLALAANRRIRRIHRTFIAQLILFVIAHLAVNLTAIRDLDIYNQAAGWFRLAWRTPIAEPILIGLLATQVVTGLMLALDAAMGRSTFEHLCQITAGAFIAVFLMSHTLAVAVLGRDLLNRGPDFTFASAGPAGLFGSAQGAALFPYYGLGVVAVFVHLARPVRLYVMRKAGEAQARRAAAVLAGVAVVLSALLLRALVHPGGRS